MGNTGRKRGYRSLFWPIILISVGAIWLLGNLGVLEMRHLAVLFQLWPLLLIAIGLDLLLGRSSTLIGAVIALGTVALAIVLMVAGPGLGLVPNIDIQQTTITEPLGDAQSADVTFDLSVAEVIINSLENSSDLIAGDVTHFGTLDFQVEGGRTRSVYLGLKEGDSGFNLNLGPLGGLFPANSDTQLRWDVGLSPAIPLNLNINGGVGEADLLLDGLQLTALDINGGVGDITLTLPAGEYRATLDGGVGNFLISLAPGADVTLDANGGVGQVTVDVPDDAAVRVEANGGLGDINVPSSYTQVSRGDNDPRIWETVNFGQAEAQITILYTGGIGGLTIR